MAQQPRRQPSSYIYKRLNAPFISTYYIGMFILHNYGIFIYRKARSPELEVLKEIAMKKAGESTPDLQHCITELQTKTLRLHAAFLFDGSHGLQTLRMLCLCLSSTKNSLHFAGWEEFGIYLGLNPLLIEVIRLHICFYSCLECFLFCFLCD
jgi:hypothetical protein